MYYRNFPNGDRRSFKADLRPITDVEPQFLRRFTADLRPECNICRSFRPSDRRQFAVIQGWFFALNQPRFDFGRPLLGHKKMRTWPSPCRQLAPFHPKILFIFRCQILPHFLSRWVFWRSFLTFNAYITNKFLYKHEFICNLIIKSWEASSKNSTREKMRYLASEDE